MIFQCPRCEKAFSSIYLLNSHLNTHADIKDFFCSLCSLSFASKSELSRHKRYKHTEDKPYKCTECDYASVESTKLKRHMRTHTGKLINMGWGFDEVGFILMTGRRSSKWLIFVLFLWLPFLEDSAPGRPELLRRIAVVLTQFFVIFMYWELLPRPRTKTTERSRPRTADL